MGLYINGIKTGKPYINGIKHNAYIDGQRIWNDTPAIEEFSITVQDNGSFNIPTRGVKGNINIYQSYDWEIDWGDGNIETVSGTGTSTSSIPHTYTDNENIHTIIIRPNGTPTQGWLKAFGCKSANTTNSYKIKSINSPISEFMRPIDLVSHSQMFSFTGLISLPENLLPATTLAEGCYRTMFYYCYDLTSLPENLLPATTLAENCYSQMFDGCVNLIDIGNIDADWFSARTSQHSMFTNCTSIATPITYNDIPSGWK
jgi:hypothetical protein